MKWKGASEPPPEYITPAGWCVQYASRAATSLSIQSFGIASHCGILYTVWDSVNISNYSQANKDEVNIISPHTNINTHTMYKSIYFYIHCFCLHNYLDLILVPLDWPIKRCIWRPRWGSTSSIYSTEAVLCVFASYNVVYNIFVSTVSAWWTLEVFQCISGRSHQTALANVDGWARSF